MDSRSILVAVVPILITLVNYAVVRDLLWSIFLGNKSKKSATRIRGEAKWFSRFTQNYMKPYITKYEKDFKLWMVVKRVLLALTVLQAAAFTVMIIMKVPFWIVGVVCAALVVLNAVLFIIMMGETESSDNKQNRKGTPWKYEQPQKKK